MRPAIGFPASSVTLPDDRQPAIQNDLGSRFPTALDAKLAAT